MALGTFYGEPKRILGDSRNPKSRDRLIIDNRPCRTGFGGVNGCRKRSEWVPLSILSVPLAGCLPSLDQASKHILTTSAFRTFIHFLPSTHCGPAIVHENTLRGMRCHGTRHAVGSFAFHWCGWVDRPSLQSEPSTSEDENTDLAQVL